MSWQSGASIRDGTKGRALSQQLPATPSNGPAEELRSAATAAKATGPRALCNLYLSMHHYFTAAPKELAR
ncbi:hypothetical protein PG989_000187 [Apiospora arundinis]